MPRKIVGLLLALLLIAGCKRAADLRTERERALALVAQYVLQLEAQRAQLDALEARAGLLPPGLPGADAVATIIARNRAAIASLRGAIDQVPGQAEAAMKAGRGAELATLIDATAEQQAGGLIAIGNDVAVAERTVIGLENQARAMVPAIDAGAPAIIDAR